MGLETSRLANSQFLGMLNLHRKSSFWIILVGVFQFIEVHISANKNDAHFLYWMHMQVPLLPLLLSVSASLIRLHSIARRKLALDRTKNTGLYGLYTYIYMGCIYIYIRIYIYTSIHPDLPIVSPMAWLSHVITLYHHLRWYLPLRWAMGDRLATGLLL